MMFGTPNPYLVKIAATVCGLALLAPVAASVSRSHASGVAQPTISAASEGLAPAGPLDGFHW
jgi:hypothetical protein